MIEVNGRIGGIPGVIAAATGVEMRTVAMRVALGERVVFETLPPTTGVGFRLDRYADVPAGVCSPSRASTRSARTRTSTRWSSTARPGSTSTGARAPTEPCVTIGGHADAP